MQGNTFLLIFLFLTFLNPYKIQLQTIISSNSDKLKSTSTGRFLKSLMEMTSKPSYTSLFDALDLLVSDLNSKKATQNNLLNENTQLHDRIVSQLEENIKKNEQNIAELQQSLNNNLEPEEIGLKDEIKTKEDNIERISKEIESTNKLREEEKTQNEQRISDLTEGIESIKEAIILLEGLTVQEGVFLQINMKKKVISIKEKLGKNLKNLKGNYQYKPIIEALTQLGTQGFIDPIGLNKVINLLKEIRDELNQNKVNIIEQEKISKNNYDESITTLKKDLEINQDYLIESKNKLIEVQGKIEIAHTQLKSENVILERNQQDLEKENSNWEKKSKNYNDLISQIESEIEIVNQCIVALKTAGLSA